MSKKEKIIRMSLTLTAEQSRKLNAYAVKVTQHQGKIPFNIYTKIARWGVEEWLERHGTEVDINWDERV